jgi:predicted enzyme related to lactoylglutathione lyase
LDLAAEDPDAISAFYGALFGWTAVAGPPETGGYRQFHKGAAAVAGLGPKMMPEQPLVWTLYVQTSDIDATVAKATSLGATVVAPPMQVLTFGKMAVLFDTVGAAIGLWQPDEMKGFDIVDEHGAWTWSELMSNDVEASAKFYGALFGWESSVMQSEPFEYREMKLDGQSVAGIMERPGEVPAEVPNFWSAYFTVDSLDDATATVNARGGNVFVGPMEIGPGTFAQFTDPQGAVVGLLQPKGSSTE